MPWATWGPIPLKVMDLDHAGGEPLETEDELVPDPAADHDAEPSTVLTGGGRNRRRWNVRGWCDRTDFYQLRRLKAIREARLLTLADDIPVLARIGRLEGREDARTSLIWITAEFVEAVSGP